MDPSIDPGASSHEESKTSTLNTVALLQSAALLNVRNSNQSSSIMSVKNKVSIVDEETERIEAHDPADEAKEVEFCIKGYDFQVSEECIVTLTLCSFLSFRTAPLTTSTPSLTAWKTPCTLTSRSACETARWKRW